MRNVVNNYIEKFRHEKQIRRRFVSVAAALALIVSCGVFWQLRADGVAMANETFCGLEEHQHSEECCEPVLTCGLEESEDTSGHTHDESCYETEVTIICGLEETEGHTHIEDCCGEEGILICGQEESPGHTHADECCETAQTLICGLEESEASEGHTHTEGCYEEQLICDIPEHTHTIACMSDETADVETAIDWENTLPEELTGVWAEDVVAIARSQLGYTESTRNFVVSEDDNKQKGYTRYGAWYGNPYGDWCAMFASFCLYYAGVPEWEFPEADGCWAWTVALDKRELYADAETSEYVPVPGDLVFFNSMGDNGKPIDHVGIVEEVKYQADADGENVPVSLVTIEGNSSGMVLRNDYSLSDSSIVGYGVLPGQLGPESDNEPTEAETEDEDAEPAVCTIAYVYGNNGIAEGESADGVTAAVVTYDTDDFSQEIEPEITISEEYVIDGYYLDADFEQPWDGSVELSETVGDIEDVEEMNVYVKLLADVAVIDDDDDEYVYPVDIFKFTGDWDTGDVTALPGAEFVLSKVVTEADEVTGVETEVTYYGVFDKTEENAGEPGTIYYFTLIDWTTDISGATALVSGDDGFIHMADLPAETTYYMTEIKAPDGYMLSDKVIQFYLWIDEGTGIGYVTDETVINAGIYKYYDLDDQIITLYIGNEADAELPDTGGAELPNTGGAGTGIFTMLGLLIMGGAALSLFTYLLLKNKRRGERDEKI